MAHSRIVRLPPMPKVSDLLRVYGLSAQKQLSQNFILDLNITDKIAKVADVFDCYVCEVGAGPGSLTRSVLQAGARHVAAVELDKRFLPSLQLLEDAAKGRMTVYHADIMKFDIPSAFPDTEPSPWEPGVVPGVRMVGNLPFSVSIPLLLQWLEAIPQKAGPFKFGRTPMSLVFQKEVAENIVASSGSYDRSRLTIMVQYLCEVKKKYHLPNSVFVPKPKVDASLIHLVPRPVPLISAPYVVIEQVVKAVYAMRRKFIHNPLKLLFPGKEHLVEDLVRLADINTEQRAHEVTMSDFDKLCRAYVELSATLDLPLQPLQVNRPVRVADYLKDT
ncbi:dimethyladenosine transferase 1, mitochondrial-like isoform X2 [Actinia tenebrosa]|uniref:rRNA adenine N(6)-methyltransferase n=1 Tax=Actinia tenebrosa TaxID=6105 RepID=A0A6P8HRL6_ACTTE|nr:dimethyladenosine transferase 1, mitochondrial-like isoform X2 [Actinia tenebrosa]